MESKDANNMFSSLKTRRMVQKKTQPEGLKQQKAVKLEGAAAKKKKKISKPPPPKSQCLHHPATCARKVSITNRFRRT